jgi:hypothetical protein
MRRHIAFLLYFLVGAGSALADETINQLSPGTALGGAEMIPMYQTTNPAVATTPRAITTYVPTQFASIDPTQSSGSDMCAKISAAAAALAQSHPGGGVIDARGFSGSQHCAGNMFANWPASPFWATVIFGDVQIQTDVQVAIPSFTGMTGTTYSDNNAPGPHGFTIQASNAFPANTALVALAPIPSTTASFGVQIKYLAVSCNAPNGTTPTGSIGIQNVYGQEQTTFDHIIIRGCYTGLQIAGAIGDMNSYTHIAVGDNPGVSSSSFVCLQVGSPSYSVQDNGIFDINYFECNTTGAVSTNKILLNGNNYSMRHVYMENNGSAGATNFICIGCQASPAPGAYNITMEDVVCDGSTAAAAGSSCIALQSGANYGTFNIMNVQAQPSGTMYLINDGASPGTGCQITSGFSAGQEWILGFYSRGTGGRIVNTSSVCPKP